jgi:phage I-like protein
VWFCHAANDFFNDEHNEEPPMNALLAALLAALGLDDKATEPQALTALNAFLVKTKEVDDKVVSLAADLATANKTHAPDPAKFVPIETVTAMQTQLSALSNQINGGKWKRFRGLFHPCGAVCKVLDVWQCGLERI